MIELTFIPKRIFERIVSSVASPVARVAAFAACARVNTLSMIMMAGSGHIGTSFSAMDVLCRIFLIELDGDPSGRGDRVFFSSKGHDVPGLYAVLTALGVIPFDNVKRLRRLGGLPGHPDMKTPGIVTNTGSLGMGVSKAKGMVRAMRQFSSSPRVFVMTGDGELQEGQFWESLVGAANDGLFEITVVVDHNKIQSDTLVTATSDLGDLEAKFRAFGWRVLRVDGHDLGQLGESLEIAESERARPTAIIADTIKGMGVSFMRGDRHAADAMYKFHSGAPSPDDYRRALSELTATSESALLEIGIQPEYEADEVAPKPAPPTNGEALVAAYSDALVTAGESDERIWALDADLALDTGLIPFRSRYPERFVECGIAEQDMVSQAGGMALRGLLPVVHSFASFLTPRANEQIYNNASEGSRIIYAGSLAGLTPAGPGHSHQSVRDVALMACVPGMAIIAPGSAAEVEHAVKFARTHDGCTYLRFESQPYKRQWEAINDGAFKPGQGVVVAGEGKTAIVAYGPTMLTEAIRAQAILAARGVAVQIINHPWLNSVEPEWFHRLVSSVDRILVLDNHLRSGGLGERYAAALALPGHMDKPALICLAPDSVPCCGANDEVLVAHGLDAATIAQKL